MISASVFVLSEPFASFGVSGGTQGTIRGVGTYTTQQGVWLPYLALEGYHTDGLSR
jgi:hypothetical protein